MRKSSIFSGKTGGNSTYFFVASVIITLVMMTAAVFQWYKLFCMAFFAIFLVPLFSGFFENLKEMNSVKRYYKTEEENENARKISKILED